MDRRNRDLGRVEELVPAALLGTEVLGMVVPPHDRLWRLETRHCQLGPVLADVRDDVDEAGLLGDQRNHVLERALVLRGVDVLAGPDTEKNDLHAPSSVRGGDLSTGSLRPIDHGAVETIAMSRAPQSLLHRYYRDVMEPAFAPAELMQYDELLAAVRSPGTDGLVVLGDGRPVAGVMTEEYVDGALLLLAYVVVAPSHRGRGTGGELIGSAVGGEGRPVLAEIEDPRFHGTHPLRGDPVSRLRFYDRLGSRLLPVPYVQPSLRPGSPRVRNLLLITVPSRARVDDSIDGHLVANFLTEYFTTCEGDDVEGDETFSKLRAAARGDGRLRLRRLDELEYARTAPDSPDDRGPSARG
jgi:GNAT superfamily N-acetyltransferase